MPSILPILQRIWRRLPVSGALRTALGPYLWHFVTAPGRKRLRQRIDPTVVPPGPLIISACLSDRTGIGRAGRLTVKAAAELQPLVHDIPADPAARQIPADLPAGGVWLAHCNAPEVALVLSQAPEHLWASRYRIGYWAYELPRLPANWVQAIPFFHEIWTPSQFVADAVEAARGDAGTTVRVVPHPVALDPPTTLPQPNGPLTFLVMFDARSSLDRKNPLGAIKAFQRAFAADDTSVRLVVKIMAAWKHPRAVAGLKASAAGWPSIIFSEAELTDAEALQMLASADCLVSLHRAEGFGLPMAEAMLAGVPVIATDWSGNVDFTRGASYEVPSRLIAARDASGRYHGTGQQWADPDIGAAAEALRQVREDEAGRRAMGLKGRQRVEALCSGLPPECLAILSGPNPAFVAKQRQFPAAEDRSA